MPSLRRDQTLSRLVSDARNVCELRPEVRAGAWFLSGRDLLQLRTNVTNRECVLSNLQASVGLPSKPNHDWHRCFHFTLSNLVPSLRSKCMAGVRFFRRSASLRRVTACATVLGSEQLRTEPSSQIAPPLIRLRRHPTRRDESRLSARVQRPVRLAMLAD